MIQNSPQRLPIARLLAPGRDEAPLLIVATLVLLLGSAASLLMPRAVQLLFDCLGTINASRALRHSMLLILGAILAQVLLSYARGVLFTIAGERVVARLRRALFRSLLDKETAFFDGARTSDLISRLGADTALLQQAITLNLSMGLRHGLVAIGCLVIMLKTSLTLTLLLFGLVPLIACVGILHGRFLRGLSRQIQDQAARSTSIAEEALSGIRTVRAFAREDAEAARYDQGLSTLLGLVRRRAYLGGAFQAAGGVLGAGALVTVLFYGGDLVVRGQFGAGALTAYLLYAVMLCASLAGLDDTWTDLMRAAGAGERVFEWMEEPAAATSGARPAAVVGALQFRDVRFSYPTRPEAPVLRALSLTVSPGEVVAIVGPSGGGKSTLAALLLRLYEPQAGQVLLDGRELRDLDPRWLREQVGLVAQDAVLFSTSIAENIRYGRPDASQAEVEAAARAANIHSFIAALPEGYETPVGERGVCLSGGQRQRIAIARVLLKDPPVIILDEATSALDADSERLVQDALERLMVGRTTLLITHRPSWTKRASRVIRMQDGKIEQPSSEFFADQVGRVHAEAVSRAGTS